jgi:hypothetical protein
VVAVILRHRVDGANGDAPLVEVRSENNVEQWVDLESLIVSKNKNTLDLLGEFSKQNDDLFQNETKWMIFSEQFAKECEEQGLVDWISSEESEASVCPSSESSE